MNKMTGSIEENANMSKPVFIEIKDDMVNINHIVSYGIELISNLDESIIDVAKQAIIGNFDRMNTRPKLFGKGDVDMIPLPDPKDYTTEKNVFCVRLSSGNSYHFDVNSEEKHRIKKLLDQYIIDHDKK